jgi:hypothetical protein
MGHDGAVFDRPGLRRFARGPTGEVVSIEEVCESGLSLQTGETEEQ